MKYVQQFSFLLALTILLPATPAHAYIDSSTISMTLQAVIGGAAAAIMFVKLYFRRIFSFLRRSGRPKDNEAGPAD